MMSKKLKVYPIFWVEFKKLPLKMRFNVLWWSLFNRRRLENFIKGFRDGKSMRYAYKDSK